MMDEAEPVGRTSPAGCEHFYTEPAMLRAGRSIKMRMDGIGNHLEKETTQASKQALERNRHAWDRIGQDSIFFGPHGWQVGWQA